MSDSPRVPVAKIFDQYPGAFEKWKYRYYGWRSSVNRRNTLLGFLEYFGVLEVPERFKTYIAEYPTGDNKYPFHMWREAVASEGEIASYVDWLSNKRREDEVHQAIEPGGED